MSNIILIGYRGTGKTTIGKRLAQELDMRFFDLDEEISLSTERTIPEIFTEFGEEGFRELEEFAVQCACEKDKVVISTGGGAILSETNRLLMRESGTVILLEASIETIYSRIKDDNERPALTDYSPKEEIEKVLEKRNPLYRQTAHFAVSTDKISIEEVVKKILKKFNILRVF